MSEARSYYRGRRTGSRAKEMTPEWNEARAWWFAAKSARAALHLTERSEGWSGEGRYHAERAVRNHWALAVASMLNAMLGGAS